MSSNETSSNDYASSRFADDNVLDDEAEEYFFYVVFYKWLVPTLFGLIIVIGVIGNLIVIAVTLTSRRMRTTVNVLMLNLAASDLTFLIVCVPFTTYHYAADNWAIGDLACKLYQYVLYVTVYVTVYTLVAIAVVRFIRIVRSCHPRRGDGLRRTANARSRLRMSLSAAILAAIWLTMLAANWPVLAMYRVKAYETSDEKPAYYYCGLKNGARWTLPNATTTSSPLLPFEAADTGFVPDHAPRVLFLTFFILAYVIPLTIIATMYVLIARYLHRKTRQSIAMLRASTSKSVTSTASTRGRTTDSRRNRSMTTEAARGHRSMSYTWRVFCSVVIAFAVCWLPLHVHLLIAYFGRQPQTRSYEVYRVGCHCLAYFESCVNPIVYHYVSADFRRGFGELVSAVRRQICSAVACIVAVFDAVGSRCHGQSNSVQVVDAISASSHDATARVDIVTVTRVDINQDQDHCGSVVLVPQILTVDSALIQPIGVTSGTETPDAP